MLWGKRGCFGEVKSPLSFWEAHRQGLVATPEIRAAGLLARFLPKSVFARYCYTGEIPAIGQITGRQYLIRRKEEILELSRDGSPIYSYCIHVSYSDNVPPSDNVLAQWLAITADEFNFLNTANRHELRTRRPVVIFSNNESYQAAFKEFLFDDLIQNVHLSDIPVRPDIPQWEDDLFYFPEFFRKSEKKSEKLNDSPPVFLSFEDFLSVPATRESRQDQALDAINRHLDRQTREIIERHNRLLYDGTLGISTTDNYIGHQFDENLCHAIPRRNPENEWITSNLALLCLTTECLYPGTTDYEIQTINGVTEIPVVEWKCQKCLDDLFLFMLLSAYTNIRHQQIISDSPSETPEWHETVSICDEDDGLEDILPDVPATKCIMSSQVYRDLTGNIPDFTHPIYYDNKQVIIDDRADYFIFFLPRIEYVGHLVFLPRQEKEKIMAGMVILEPQNVVIRCSRNNRLHVPSLELCMDAIYSCFPRNTAADGLAYEVETAQRRIKQETVEFVYPEYND